MNKIITFQVLSPDGFIIERDVEHYSSLKEAEIAYDKWAKRYETQGYYSSNKGKIPLNELLDHCKILKKIKKNHE